MKRTSPDELARRRATFILKVQTGAITATQAATALGVSRKTYYEWERRALEGLLAAMKDRPAGRPSKPTNPEKEQLRSRVAELELEVKNLQGILQIRTAIDELKKGELDDLSRKKARRKKKAKPKGRRKS